MRRALLLRPVSLAIGALLAGSAVAAPTQSIATGIEAVRDGDSGHARLLRFDAGARGPQVRDVESLAQTRALDAVRRYAAEFGAATGSDYAIVGRPFTHADIGVTAVRYAQRLADVPVFGAQLVANVRSDGALTLLAGKLSDTPLAEIDLHADADAATAAQVARDYVALRNGVPADSLDTEQKGQWIHDPGLIGPGTSTQRPALVWQTVVTSRVGDPLRVVVLADADTLDLRLAYNTIHASTLGPHAGTLPKTASTLPLPAITPKGLIDADLATYDGNNGNGLPGTLVCDEGNLACTNGTDPDADLAHFHANGTWDLYFYLHGRDSLDGWGMQLRSTVHHRTGYCNAFWNGAQMAYGDGCNIVLDDVVAHELTHGVTSYTSDLIYAYDSGAINESFSDVWGEYYDLGNGTAEDIPAARWVMGEELQAGGLRNMKDPTLLGDPDRVLSPNFWTDARDTGGVHINSGINNKAAYLLADGGTFNGQTITGLGMEKPLHIYYYAQTMLLGPSSTYNDLGLYLATACDALVGTESITAADCAQVDAAVLATEMAERSPHLPDSADICSTPGEVAQDVLFDDFENDGVSAARWTTAASTGANVWTVSTLLSPISGIRSMRADNVNTRSDSTVTTTNGILIPANAWLHFEQKYLWEYDGWDGGILQYSTNNGASWTKVQNAQMTGETYPGLMSGDSDAAFANQTAFTGDSFGAGSTRVSLAALAGQTVKLRFFASADSSTAPGNLDGWWIDNVRIYTCVASPGISVTPTSGLVTSEAGDEASFDVVLDTAPSDDVVIALSSSDTGEGTVTPPTLTFTPGNWDTAQTVTVTGVGDNTVDGDSGYSIILAPATSDDAGYAGIDPSDVSVTNGDDDSASLSIGDVTLAEGNVGNTAFVFTATLSGNVAGGFTVPFATADGTAVAPGDYASDNDVLTFAGTDGETQTIEISIVADTLVEDDEAFEVALGTASNPAVTLADGVAEGTIVNDDDEIAESATIAIGDVTLAEGGTGTTTFTFTVTLNGNITGGFTVPFATSGATATAPGDYADIADVLTFAGVDGETQTFAVNVVGDAVYEGDETFAVTLGAPSNPDATLADGTASGTILDDDHTADIAVSNLADHTLVEPGQTVSYTVTVRNLDAAIAQPAVAIVYALPAALTGATWTCSATGGAACNAPEGTGTFDTTLALPPGADVTFVLTATVAADANGADRIETIASAGVALPYVDPNDANDTATATAQLRHLFSDDFE